MEVVSTAGVAPTDRFAAWRETLARVAMPVEVRTSHAADFTATVATASVGGLQAISLHHPPLEIDRTRLMIRRSDPEVYHVALNLAGRQLFTQERNTTTIEPGDFTFYHSSRIFRTSSDDRVPRESAVAVVIPPFLLPLPPDRLRALLAARLSSKDAIGSLVAHHLRVLAGKNADLHPADAARLSYLTIDLIAMMLARRLDAVGSLPVETQEQALFASVQAFIQGRLGDPALTPEAIAAAHHVSLRTLHRLFHAHGLTVAGWIRELRLDRCRLDLADPVLGSQSVRTIAAHWGFTDRSHFSRAFRAAYGMSPRAYRESAWQAVRPAPPA
jgi:AraC-like DNA-binding protein